MHLFLVQYRMLEMCLGASFTAVDKLVGLCCKLHPLVIIIIIIITLIHCVCCPDADVKTHWRRNSRQPPAIYTKSSRTARCVTQSRSRDLSGCHRQWRQHLSTAVAWQRDVNVSTRLHPLVAACSLLAISVCSFITRPVQCQFFIQLWIILLIKETYFTWRKLKINRLGQ